MSHGAIRSVLSPAVSSGRPLATMSRPEKKVTVDRPAHSEPSLAVGEYSCRDIAARNRVFSKKACDATTKSARYFLSKKELQVYNRQQFQSAEALLAKGQTADAQALFSDATTLNHALVKGHQIVSVNGHRVHVREGQCKGGAKHEWPAMDMGVFSIVSETRLVDHTVVQQLSVGDIQSENPGVFIVLQEYISEYRKAVIPINDQTCVVFCEGLSGFGIKVVLTRETVKKMLTAEQSSVDSSDKAARRMLKSMTTHGMDRLHYSAVYSINHHYYGLACKPEAVSREFDTEDRLVPVSGLGLYGFFEKIHQAEVPLALIGDAGGVQKYNPSHHSVGMQPLEEGYYFDDLELSLIDKFLVFPEKKHDNPEWDISDIKREFEQLVIPLSGEYNDTLHDISKQIDRYLHTYSESAPLEPSDKAELLCIQGALYLERTNDSDCHHKVHLYLLAEKNLIAAMKIVIDEKWDKSVTLYRDLNKHFEKLFETLPAHLATAPPEVSAIFYKELPQKYLCGMPIKGLSDYYLSEFPKLCKAKNYGLAKTAFLTAFQYREPLAAPEKDLFLRKYATEISDIIHFYEKKSYVPYGLCDQEAIQSGLTVLVQQDLDLLSLFLTGGLSHFSIPENRSALLEIVPLPNERITLKDTLTSCSQRYTAGKGPIEYRVIKKEGSKKQVRMVDFKSSIERLDETFGTEAEKEIVQSREIQSSKEEGSERKIADQSQKSTRLERMAQARQQRVGRGISREETARQASEEAVEGREQKVSRESETANHTGTEYKVYSEDVTKDGVEIKEGVSSSHESASEHETTSSFSLSNTTEVSAGGSFFGIGASVSNATTVGTNSGSRNTSGTKDTSQKSRDETHAHEDQHTQGQARTARADTTTTNRSASSAETRHESRHREERETRQSTESQREHLSEGETKSANTDEQQAIASRELASRLGIRYQEGRGVNHHDRHRRSQQTTQGRMLQSDATYEVVSDTTREIEHTVNQTVYPGYMDIVRVSSEQTTVITPHKIVFQETPFLTQKTAKPASTPSVQTKISLEVALQSLNSRDLKDPYDFLTLSFLAPLIKRLENPHNRQYFIRREQAEISKTYQSNYDVLSIPCSEEADPVFGKLYMYYNRGIKDTLRSLGYRMPTLLFNRYLKLKDDFYTCAFLHKSKEEAERSLQELFSFMLTEVRLSDRQRSEVLRFGEKVNLPRVEISATGSGKYLQLDSDKTGFVVGEGRLSEADSCRHLVVIGGSGTGKTSRIILPNLLALSKQAPACSVIVNDIKGELHRATADRFARNGFTVKVLDFTNPERGERYNPLISLQTRTSDFEMQLTAICDCFVQSYKAGSQSKDDNPFWTNSANDLIKLGIRHIVGRTEVPPTLKDVYDFVVNFMSQEQENKGIFQDAKLSQELHQFYNNDPRNLGTIISTAKIMLQPIAFDLKLQDLTASNTVDFSALRSEKQIIFIKLAQSNLAYCRFLVSIFYTQFFSHCIETEGNPVYCMFDEAGHIPIPGFANILTTVRGNGVAVMAALQSEAQLSALYGDGDAKTILDGGFGSKLLFGGGSVSMAKDISIRAGYSEKRKITRTEGQLSVTTEQEPNLPEADILTPKNDKVTYVFGQAKPVQFKLDLLQEVRELSMTPTSGVHGDLADVLSTVFKDENFIADNWKMIGTLFCLYIKDRFDRDTGHSQSLFLPENCYPLIAHLGATSDSESTLLEAMGFLEQFFKENKDVRDHVIRGATKSSKDIEDIIVENLDKIADLLSIESVRQCSVKHPISGETLLQLLEAYTDAQLMLVNISDAHIKKPFLVKNNESLAICLKKLRMAKQERGSA